MKNKNNGATKLIVCGILTVYLVTNKVVTVRESRKREIVKRERDEKYNKAMATLDEVENVLNKKLETAKFWDIVTREN